MKIELRPLHPSFGAEVVSVDLAQDLDEVTVAAIQDAWTWRSTCRSARGNTSLCIPPRGHRRARRQPGGRAEAPAARPL